MPKAHSTMSTAGGRMCWHYRRSLPNSRLTSGNARTCLKQYSSTRISYFPSPDVGDFSGWFVAFAARSSLEGVPTLACGRRMVQFYSSYSWSCMSANQNRKTVHYSLWLVYKDRIMPCSKRKWDPRDAQQRSNRHMASLLGMLTVDCIKFQS
jgi:hypothetical protein